MFNYFMEMLTHITIFSSNLTIEDKTLTHQSRLIKTQRIPVDINNNIFISYTVKENFDSENFFSYSLDGGVTFETQLPLGYFKPASLKYYMNVSDDNKIYALQFNNDTNWGVRLYQSTNNEDNSGRIVHF